MGWFDFLRREPAPAPAPGPFTAADFPMPDPVPGRAARAADRGPVAFAVIRPGGASAEDLREIGGRLQEWRERNPRVLEILGLEQLLDGRQPETPAWHFFLPMPPENEPVALVFVDAAAADEATALELAECLAGARVAMLVSPEYYSAMMR